MLFRLGALVCFGAIAYVGALLITELGIGFGRSRLTDAEWIAVGIGMIISAHVVLVIHELGHVMGGWLAGYRLRELTVGLVKIERQGQRLRVGLNLRLQHYGGFVRMMPGEAEESKGRTVLLLVLGPAASLTAGAVITIASIVWLSDPRLLGLGLAEVFLAKQVAVIGVGSVVVGLANLVPVSFHGRRSDGAKLWDRIREPNSLSE